MSARDSADSARHAGPPRDNGGTRYAFYPGCTLHSTGVEFGVSTELVCEALGLEMVEIPDWNCCGASSAHSMDAHPVPGPAGAQPGPGAEVGTGRPWPSPARPATRGWRRPTWHCARTRRFRAKMESVLGFALRGAGAAAQPAGHRGQRRVARERCGARSNSRWQGLKVVSLLWLPADPAAGVHRPLGRPGAPAVDGPCSWS